MAKLEIFKINKNENCLACGINKPQYCEDCYQKLIAENARLQNELANSLPKYTVLQFIKKMDEVYTSFDTRAIQSRLYFQSLLAEFEEGNWNQLESFNKKGE